jgi:hypothetical protein
LEVLRSLRDGDYRAAREAVGRLCALASDTDVQRLLAVTYLLAGKYEAAFEVYNGMKDNMGS